MTATVSTSVAGSWIDGAPVVTGGGLHQVINPATGEAVAEYALAAPADVDRAVASARAALRGWATATPADRSAVLAKLAQLAGEHADDLVAEEVSQTGKPVRLATEFDVPGSVDNIDFFAGAARHLEGKATAEYSGDHTSSIRREAVGVVGTITPWNYPLQMAVWKVLPALAAGCTRRDQALRADTVDDADAGPAGQRGRPARRGVQRGDRRRLRRRHRAGRTPRCRRGDVHRVDRRSAAK